MDHISRDCHSRDVSGGREEQGGLLPRWLSFADDSGRGRGNLIEVQDKFWKKNIGHFEQSLRNKVDLMAAKRRQEESQPESVKRMKEMAREKGSKKF